MIFSTILKGLREERNLNQKDVAERLNLSRQSIALYETGKREPNYKTLSMIADFYHVSIDYLFGRVENSKPAAYMIGNNIRLLRGSKSYTEMAKNIGNEMAGSTYTRAIDPTTLQYSGGPPYSSVADTPSLAPGETVTVTFYFLEP